MTDKPKPRGTQTRVKHRILEEYMKAWGGIIIQGTASSAKRARMDPSQVGLHLVYVDCNAFRGRYPSGPGDPPDDPETDVVFGSPVIGLRALDSLARTAGQLGISLRTNAIFVEQDPDTLRELEGTLEMTGLGWGVRFNSNFDALRSREVALVRADSTQLAPKLTTYTAAGRYTHSLYFLDPYGPKGIPLGFVSEIVKQNRTDSIINMPYQDLHKKARLAARPVHGASEEATLGNYDNMFGDLQWRTVAHRIQASPYWQEESPAGDTATVDSLEARDAASLEVELAELYRDILRRVDPELAVKSLPLRFPDRERTMFHLYLTTHDGTGALTMNGLLRNAKIQENEIRLQLQAAKRVAKREHQNGMTDMFAGTDLSAAPSAVTFTPDKTEIAEELAAQFQGRLVTKGHLYKEVADSPYTASEVDSALRLLKKQQLLDFDAELRNSTQLRFAPEGQPRR